MWEVIEAYGWTPLSVHERGGVWEVNDGEESYALKETDTPKEKLYLLFQMLEQVRTSGFPHLLPWIPTSTGEVVVSAYGKQWYATPWQKPADLHLSATELASSLGRFHRLAEPIAAKYPKLHQVIDQEYKNTWQERESQISGWQKALDTEKITISEQSAQISRQGFSFAIRGLDRFVKTEKGVAPRYTISHQRIHPSNVLAGEDGWYWIDFDHAELDTPVKDLAALIHRYPETLPAEILAAYEEENPLLPKEKRLLSVFLSYPERLVRAVERNAENVDLQQETAHIRACQHLVKQLWPKKKKQTKRRSR
jgi:Ser/Thr protein kinase RdoA (MazF antagonist)